MTNQIVTEAGFYNGVFMKPGQHYDDSIADGESAGASLDKLSKDELLAEAQRRDVTGVNASNTKAEIIAAIEAK